MQQGFLGLLPPNVTPCAPAQLLLKLEGANGMACDRVWELQQGEEVMRIQQDSPAQVEVQNISESKPMC